MALPPKGDSQRPLQLAIRSMRVLGILMIIIAVLVGGVLSMAAARTQKNGVMTLVMILMALVYGTPGIANVVLTIYLKQRKYWAVITSIVLASLELLVCVLGLVSNIVAAGMGKQNTGGIFFSGIFVLAFGQLLMQLIQALKALNDVPMDGSRGFDVLGVQPPIQAPLPPDLRR